MGSIIIILLTALNVWLTLISIFKVYVVKYKLSINGNKMSETYEEKVKCTIILAVFLIVLSVLPVIGLLSLFRYVYLYFGVGGDFDVKKIEIKSILFSQI